MPSIPNIPKRNNKNLLVAAISFGILGVAALLLTKAESTLSISGTVFKDTNRNGVQDTGEEPMPGKEIILIDEVSQNYVSSVGTNASGQYSFQGLGEGKYLVEYGPTSWGEVRNELVPTTTGSVYPKISVNLTNHATANFGWRQIIRSTNVDAPISTFTTPSGTKINSYNDAVSANELYGYLTQGSLLTQEAPFVTIRFDYKDASGICVVGISGTPGNYSNYSAGVSVPYLSFLDNGDLVLFHEYGHAWSQYYAYISHQSTNLADYLKLRGIENDARLDTSHAWSRLELIAEDYRQLFGSPNAQSIIQENLDLPLAKDVPGLKEYLSGKFMLPTTSSADTTAPTVPGGLSSPAQSDNSITLSWTPSTDNVGVAKYYIYRNGQQVGYVNAPSTTYYDSGLTPSTAYQYTVKAVDAANNTSAASTAVVVSTNPSPDNQAPSAPLGLTSPSQTNSSIALKWNPSTDNVGVMRYKIYKIGGSRKNTLNTLIGTVSSSTFTVTGLNKGTSYSFYVVAEDAAGNQSSPSSTLTVRTRR